VNHFTFEPIDDEKATAYFSDSELSPGSQPWCSRATAGVNEQFR
jgi:hypothetical protein